MRSVNPFRLFSRYAAASVVAGLCVCADAQAQSPGPTAELLKELIQVDTSNPPGNEARIDDLLAAKLRPLGFRIDIVPTPVPGKSVLFARLKGDGGAKPVLIASHGDVVGVERDKWTVDPFAGLTKDGYIYGRGAIDFKGGMAVFAQAVMELARNKVPLKRDVIFLVEADEESATYNTSWLAQSHWDKMDCEFALNEGGWIMTKPNGEVRYVSVSTNDKSSIAILLTARGTSTHSSMPLPDNAIFSLARALTKLGDYETKVELTPSTRQFFSTLGQTADGPMKQYFSDLVDGRDPVKLTAADKAISEDPLLHAIMRTTIAPVIIDGGFRGNVIPGSAEANVNFRTIPGTTAEDLVAMVKKIVNDPRIEVTAPRSNPARPGTIPNSVAGTQDSTTDTALYRALAASANRLWPGVPVTPYLFQAGTDAIAWRSRGVPVYGIYPYPISNDDLRRMHGNDERVPIQSLEQGTKLIYDTLLAVAGK
jgi:acetylornithine deacetylase/succinyl-diaminopimelate desuccinylase-like protein